MTALANKGFGPGDAYGKTEQAAEQARREISALEEGSPRQKLYILQEQLASADDMEEVECPLQHVFAPGVYARTIFIPAGSCVVGKIHKHSHINILSQGAVTVYTEQGGSEYLEGPLTMVSEPGTKRAVYTHTDTTWTTIHLTEHTDLDKIEKETIAESYKEYDQFALEQAGQQKLEV